MIQNNKIDRKTIRGLIIDMDGVVWRGTKPLGDLPAIFARIGELGWKAIMATNNARNTPQQYLDKMQSFGVTLEPWQVINSAQAAAYALKRQLPEGGPVFIIGEDGLHQALREEGFEAAEDGALAVVAGLDFGFDYQKLRRANALIRAGALFYGTNPDPTYPSPEGLDPGAGSIIAAIETASGVSPYLAGKPKPLMYEYAMERLGTKVKETLVIGDRLDTDIAGAQALGCPTAMVLSGVNTLEEARAWNPVPDMIAEDLGELIVGSW